MYRAHVVRAWKWLLAHMIITASLSYFATVIAVLSGFAQPESILSTATYGIRHVGIPLMKNGMALGLDEGVMIFFCNLSVALLILSIVCWARLLNPSPTKEKFSFLRNQLQKDSTAKHLKIIPYFARIHSKQLRLTAFILLCVPYIATITLGLITGALLGSAHMLSSSSAIAFAYIMPHGIPEIAALLLACSIPVGIWSVIQPPITSQNPGKAFQHIDHIATSEELQSDIKMIINLLLIAGLTEAHITYRIVQVFSSG